MKHRTALLIAALLAACEQTAPRDTPPANSQSAKPKGESVAAEAPRPVLPAGAAGACAMQDGEELRVASVNAVGTEPFWGARTEGRCVTYSTPEDQDGTRIWTRVDSGPQGPVWNGALRGKQFQLSVKPSTGCSDGMSDRTYPLEAVLRVDGETRHGCADAL